MTRKRVLLSDDEPAILRATRLNLEREEVYEVRAESGSSRALATAKEF